MPLTTGSLTAARSPNSSARPIWCLVRGRSTPPRRAEDTLATLSPCRPMWTNTLHFDCSLRSLRIALGLIGPFARGQSRWAAAVFVGADGTADERHVGSLLLSTAARDPWLPLSGQRLVRLGIWNDRIARQGHVHDVAIHRRCCDRSRIAAARVTDYDIGQNLRIVERRKAHE
jgi:hypothetical protein